MITQKLMEEFMAKVSEIVAASPAKDLEKNMRASMTAMFARMDLVTREEFDVQAQVLARTREQLQALETRLSKLDGGAPAAPSAPPAADAEDAIQPS
jgi:BMFP domain-containing protein YqiC